MLAQPEGSGQKSGEGGDFLLQDVINSEALAIPLGDPKLQVRTSADTLFLKSTAASGA